MSLTLQVFLHDVLMRPVAVGDSTVVAAKWDPPPPSGATPDPTDSSDPGYAMTGFTNLRHTSARSRTIYRVDVPDSASSFTLRVRVPGFWEHESLTNITRTPGAAGPPEILTDEYHVYAHALMSLGSEDDWELDLYVVLLSVADADRPYDASRASSTTQDPRSVAEAIPRLNEANLTAWWRVRNPPPPWESQSGYTAPVARWTGFDTAGDNHADPSLGCLARGVTGWARINLEHHDHVEFPGRLYVLKRPHGNAPELVGVYVPSGIPRSFRGDVGYHVFFHPHMSGSSDHYPFDSTFASTVLTFMYYQSGVGTPATPLRFGVHNKALCAMHESVSKKVISVFPVGSPATQMGELTTQANMYRFLREIDYWLQIEEAAPNARDGELGGHQPRDRVARVAISAHSFGLNHVQSIFEHPGTPAADATSFMNVLKEVYDFDGVLAVSAEFGSFLRAVSRWYGNGTGKCLRVYYTQGQPSPGAGGPRSWFDVLARCPDHPTEQSVGAGASIAHSDRFGTIANLPDSNFWRDLVTEAYPPNGHVPFGFTENGGFGQDVDLGRDGGALFDTFHNLAPNLFLHHALRHSGFTHA